ncbi:MAG TPA: hypothetical protein VF510_13300 [Ktedonobacterales bacterium]|jgi:hypothetical protein
MERAVGSQHRPTTQRERISELSRHLREAQQLCRSTNTDPAEDEGHAQQLFGKIATLLDDIIAALSRYEREQPPSRILH